MTKYSHIKLDDYAALKLRGLPFTSKPEDLNSFFKDYDFYPESIKIGKNIDGTKTGEGAVLFKDEPECKRAYREKQGQNIAHRWIELYQMQFQEYLNFDQS